MSRIRIWIALVASVLFAASSAASPVSGLAAAKAVPSQSPYLSSVYRSPYDGRTYLVKRSGIWRVEGTGSIETLVEGVGLVQVATYSAHNNPIWFATSPDGQYGYFAEFDNGGLVSEFAMPASGEPAVELNGTSIIESFGSGLPGTYRGFTATENPAAPTSRGIVYIVTNQALTRFVYGDSGWSPGISISGASGTPFMGPSLRVGNTIYFAATNGRIASANIETSFNVKPHGMILAGAGDIMGMVYHGGFMYLSSTLGIITMFDLASLTVKDIVVYTPALATGPVRVDALYIDPYVGSTVIYLLASETESGYKGFVARINHNPTQLTIFDDALINQGTGGATSFWTYIFFQPGHQNTFVAGSNGLTSYFSVITKVDCSVHTLCASCGTVDPQYCGYCASSGTCVRDPATVAGSCPSSYWSRPPICPQISSLSPSRGSIAGNTNVVAVGSHYYPELAAQYSCIFEEGTLTRHQVPVSSVTTTSVKCASPTIPPGGSDTSVRFAGKFYVGFGALALTTASDFTYYDCDGRSCSTCFNEEECGWCARSFACTAAVSCSTDDHLSQCPVMVVSASSGAIAGGDQLTVSVTPKVALQTGEEFRCQFGTGSSVVASSLEGGFLTCTTPASTAIDTNLTLAINTQQYSTNAAPFEFYDCTAEQTCFTCLNNHPSCKWCSGTCAYSSNACTGQQTLGSCPALTNVSPAVIDSVDATAKLTLAGGFSDLAAAGLECRFRAVGSGAVRTVPVDSLTPTTIVCGIPTAPVLSVGNYEISVATNGNQVTNAHSLSLYLCSSASSCDTCFDPITKPSCRWCSDLSTLACGSYTAGTCFELIPSDSACPLVTAVTPRKVGLAGNVSVSLTLSASVSGTPTSALCKFGSLFSVLATLSGATANCDVIPPQNVSSISDLTLVINSVQYTRATSFEYYACPTLSGSTVFRTCESCLSLPAGCDWCGNSCEATGSGTCGLNPINTCPQLLSATPNYAQSKTATRIVINTSFLPTGFTFECLFGSISSTATPINTTALYCNSPMTTAGFVDLRITARGSDGISKLIADSSVQFEFYECPNIISQACSPTCLSASSRCGWCVSQSSCTSQQVCIDRGLESGLNINEALWLNGVAGCPTIGDVWPPHIQVSQAAIDTPEINASLALSNWNLQSEITALGASVYDFECGFESTFVPVLSVDFATNSVKCQLPEFADEGFYAAGIAYKGRLITVPRTVRVLNCVKVPVCGLCALQAPECGWCLGSVRCMTSSFCAARQVPDFSSECPEIRSLSPQIAYTSGGTEITITGKQMVNSTTLKVIVGDVVVPTQYVSPTSVSFITPPLPEGTVAVRLIIEETTLKRATERTNYTEETLILNYLTDPATLTAGIAGGVTAAILFVIIAAAIIIAVVIWRKRRDGFPRLKLKEPDYLEVVCAKLLEPLWEFPEDGYALLLHRICNEDQSFYNAILGSTSTAHEDTVAEAFTFIFEHKKVIVGRLLTLINLEILRASDENVLFRNNSIATRMFKFYSKIVGLKYLFQTLAPFVVQLNMLSTKSTDKKSADPARSTNMSLVSIDVEVDPDILARTSGEMELDEGDTEANLLQLQLICQKLLNALRRSVPHVPTEFKKIFRAMLNGISAKFANDDTLLRGVGGFFFLRFYCVAIPIPHYYGLLDEPPNSVCQRQLILISKIMQCMANFTVPNEKFLASSHDFFTKNFPKMRRFYMDLVAPQTTLEAPTQIFDMPDVVLKNSLGNFWVYVRGNGEKIRHWIEDNMSKNEGGLALGTLDELMAAYPTPKRLFNSKFADPPKRLDKGKDKKAKERITN